MDKVKIKSTLLQTPSFLHKKQIEKDTLQRMYLLTDPAYRKIKETIDGETHLSNLDKQLKSILYNKKLPPYKKWLQYHNLLVNVNIFKRMLEESKRAEDTESMDKLSKLEQRIRELEENKPEMNNDSINIMESTRIEPPIYTEQLFENETADSSEHYSANNSSIHDDLQNVSVERSTESIVAVDEHGDEIVWEPPKFVFQSQEDEMQKLLDDKLISDLTVYDKIQTLSNNIRTRIFPTGEPPPHTMMVNVIGDHDRSDSKHELNQITVDPRFLILAADKNFFKLKTVKKGWIHLLMLADDYKRVRNYLVQTHQKIADAVNEYREKKSIEFCETKKLQCVRDGFEHKNIE